MKLKLLYIFPALAVLLGFTACSSDDIIDGGQQTQLSGDDVIVKASIGENSVFTRSNPIGTEAEQKNFNENDIILIYDEAQNFAVYKLDAQGVWNFYNPKATGHWDPNRTYYGSDCKPLTWDANQKVFYASYPNTDSRWDGTQRRNYYNKEGNYYSIQITDQSSLKDLVSADVMYAKATIPEKPNNHTLTLNFERQTARVIVKLRYNDQFDGLNPIVSNLRIYGDFALDSDGKSKDWDPIKPYYNSANDEYVVLLFPITADASKKFMDLTLKLDGNTTNERLTLTGTPTLEKGKSYTFNVLVGKEKMSIQSVTVNDWGDEKVIPGGEAAITLLSILNDQIGNQTGRTYTMTGKWDDNYIDDIRDFTTEHQNADLTVDLSQVTGLTEIPGNAFFDGYSSVHATGLTGIILPNSVTTIRSSAFRLTGLKSIKLSENLTNLSGGAFTDTKIETLTLPESLVKISDHTFNDMKQLKEIHFNGDITELEDNVFEGADNLQTVYLDHCTKVPKVLDTTFKNYNKAITVYVKDADMKTAFEADPNWNSHGFNFVVKP